MLFTWKIAFHLFALVGIVNLKCLICSKIYRYVKEFERYSYLDTLYILLNFWWNTFSTKSKNEHSTTLDLQMSQIAWNTLYS